MLQDPDGVTTGRLDTRYQGPDYDPLSENAEYDPQSVAVTSAFVAATNQYLRQDLNLGELTYKPSARIDPGFRWQQRYTQGGQNVMPDLAKSMKSNPKTKILLAGGYFDLATPFYEGIFEMHHLPVPQSLQANIQYRYYQAGHMIYVNDAILKQFHDDVAAFIQATKPANSGRIMPAGPERPVAQRNAAARPAAPGPLLGRDADRPRAELRRRPGHMRSNQQVWALPQRMLRRQRLGVGHIHRRANPPSFSASTSASVCTIGPRAAFTSSAPCGIRANCSAPISPCDSGVCGRIRITISALGNSPSSSPTGCTSGSVRALRRAS